MTTLILIALAGLVAVPFAAAIGGALGAHSAGRH